MPDTQYLTDEDEEELTPEELAQIQRAPNEVVNVNAQGPGDIPTVDAALPNADHLVEPTDASGPVDPRTIGAINPAGMDDIDPNAAPDAAPTPASTPSLAWTKAVNPANGQTVNVPASSRYDQAISNYEKLLSQAPTKSDPKWWQRAAAMGVGALAGYSNAASRTRNPIDIAAAKEGILQPTYASKLDAWRSRVAPAQAQLELATQQVGAQQAAAENAAKIAQQGAEAKMQTEHGDYYKNRGEQERNQWKIDPKTGQLYNTITGQVQSKPATVQDRMATAKGLGFDDESARVYGLTGKLPVDKPERAPTEWSSYLDAAGGDAGKALKLQQDARIRIARESRPPAAVVNVAGANSPDGKPDEYLTGIANYSIQAPTPRSSSPKSVEEYRNLVNAVRKINPQWDSRTYPAAQKTLNEFESGKTSQQVDAINQVAGHLRILNDAAGALGNNDINVLNRIANSVGVQTGRDPVTTYNTIVHRVSPELGRVYGTATEGENKLSAGDFDASRGPTQIHNAIGVTSNLVREKIGALRNRYEKAIPGRKFDLVSPEAESTFNTLGHGVPGAARTGMNQQAAQPSAGRPMVQHSPSTGQYRYSTDGGKTWIPGQPPQ